MEKTTHFFTDLPQELSLQIINNLSDEALIKTFLQPIYHSGRKLALQIIFSRDSAVARQFQENWLRAVLIEDRLLDYKDVFTKQLMQRTLISQNISANLRILLLGTKLILTNCSQEAGIKALRFFAELGKEEATGDLILILSKLGQPNILNTIGAKYALPFAQELIIIQLRIKQLKLLKQEDEIIKLCLTYLSLNKANDKQIKIILPTATNCLSQAGLLSLIKTLLADQRHRYDEHTIHLIKKCDVGFDDLIKHGIFEILNSHSKGNYRSQQIFNILLNKTFNVLNFEAVFSYFFAKKSNVQFFFSNFLSASCNLLAAEEGRLIKSRVAQLIWCYIEKDTKIIDILSEKTIKNYAALLTNESLAHYFKYLLKYNQLSLAVELLSDCWYPQAIQRGFLLLEQVIDNLQHFSAEEVSKDYQFLKAFADKNIPERIVASDSNTFSTQTITERNYLPNKISIFLWNIDKNKMLQDKITSVGVVKLINHLLPFLPQALAKNCGDLVFKLIYSQAKPSHVLYFHDKVIEKIIKNNFYTQNISSYLFKLLEKSELIESLALCLEEPYLDELFKVAINALSEKKTIPDLFRFCQLAITRLSLEHIEPYWLKLVEKLIEDKRFELYYAFCLIALKAEKISKDSMQKALDIAINQEKPNIYSLKFLYFALQGIEAYDFKTIFNYVTNFTNYYYFDRHIPQLVFLIIKKLINSPSCDTKLVLGWLSNNLLTPRQYYGNDIYDSVLKVIVDTLGHEEKIQLLFDLKMQADKENIKKSALCNLTEIIFESIKKSIDKQNLIATITVLSDHIHTFLNANFFEKVKSLVDEQISETLINYLLNSQLLVETDFTALASLKNSILELVQLVSKNYLAIQLPLWLQSDKNKVQELGIKILNYLIENKSSVITDLAKYIDYYFNKLVSAEKLSKYIESKEEYKESKEINNDHTNVKWRRENPQDQSSAKLLKLSNLIKYSNLEKTTDSLSKKEDLWSRRPQKLPNTCVRNDNAFRRSNKFHCLLKLTQQIEVKDYAHYLTKYSQLLKDNSKQHKLLSLYQLNILISQIDINTVKSFYPLCINLLKAMFFLFKESNLALKANAVKIYALILSKLNVKTASDFIKKLIGSEIPGVRRSSIFVIYFYFKEVEKQPTFDILLNILIDDFMKLVVDANFTVRKTMSEEIGYITQFFNASTLTTFLNNLINYHAQYKLNEGVKKTIAITLHAALTELSSVNLASALNYLLMQKNEELSVVSYKVINRKFWKNTITYPVQDLLNARAKGALSKELRTKLNAETKQYLFEIELNYAWVKYCAGEFDNLKVLPVTSILVNSESESQLMLIIKNALYRKISPSKIESRFAFLQLLSRTPNKHLLKIIASIEAELFANLTLTEALACFNKLSNTSIFIDYLAKNYMKWIEADLDKITHLLLEKFTLASFASIFSHLPLVFIHKIMNKCIQCNDMADRYNLIALALPYLKADYSKQLFASLLKETNFNLNHDIKTILLSLATQLFINEDFEPFQHLENVHGSQFLNHLFNEMQNTMQFNFVKK